MCSLFVKLLTFGTKFCKMLTALSGFFVKEYELSLFRDAKFAKQIHFQLIW